ncbi:MAG: helix-turn-helix domain-containing protein [Thermoanaerobaculia bacterium]
MKSAPAFSGSPALRIPFARPSWEVPAPLVLGDLVVDFRRQDARRPAAASDDTPPVELSPREFRLLAYFAEHRGEVVSREQLLIAVWGYRSIPLTRTVDMHVAKLRKKIEPNPREPRFLRTVHGRGYRLVPEKS